MPADIFISPKIVPPGPDALVTAIIPTFKRLRKLVCIVSVQFFRHVLKFND